MAEEEDALLVQEDKDNTVGWKVDTTAYMQCVLDGFYDACQRLQTFTTPNAAVDDLCGDSALGMVVGELLEADRLTQTVV